MRKGLSIFQRGVEGHDVEVAVAFSISLDLSLSSLSIALALFTESRRRAAFFFEKG